MLIHVSAIDYDLLKLQILASGPYTCPCTKGKNMEVKLLFFRKHSKTFTLALSPNCIHVVLLFSGAELSSVHAWVPESGGLHGTKRVSPERAEHH